MKKKELLIVIVSLVVVVVGYLGVQMFTSSDDAFPNHTISVNVHAGAGGGTDVWVRKMCSILEQDLGQSLNVSNVTGGSGGGKPDSAMGGCKEILKLDDAMAAVDDFVNANVKD